MAEWSPGAALWPGRFFLCAAAAVFGSTDSVFPMRTAGCPEALAKCSAQRAETLSDGATIDRSSPFKFSAVPIKSRANCQNAAASLLHGAITG
jgi:hypothetical protein